MSYYDIIGGYRQQILGAQMAGRMNPYMSPVQRQPAPVGGYAIGAPYGYAVGQAGQCPPNPCMPDGAALIAHGGNPRVLEVAPQCANQARQYSLNFVADGVPAGATVDIQANPQSLFKGQRLVVPSNLGIFFELNDIVVANRSQLVSPGAASCVIYAEDAVNVLQEFDTAQPGVLITLRVTNTDVDDQNFRATIFGAVVQ